MGLSYVISVFRDEISECIVQLFVLFGFFFFSIFRPGHLHEVLRSLRVLK